MTAPGIPNEFVLSTSCFGTRLRTIEDQAFAAVAMGFRKIELGQCDAPPTLNGFADSQRETGIRVTSVISGCLKPATEKPACQLLASSNAEEREQALGSVRRHIQLAQKLLAPVVVLRGTSVADTKLRQEAEALNVQLSKDGLTDELAEKIREYVHRVQKKGQRQIEHLCRSLHQLLTEFPQTKLAIEPGLHIDDLLSFEAVGWVLDDLAAKGLSYWHDVGRIHMRQKAGLPGQGRWLETYANKMLGIHLQDAADDEYQLPPGAGEVDFRLVSEYTPKSALKVLEIAQKHGRTEILGAVQFLASKGF
ncbi:MAG: sugar phosphate isomerase/epimerase [Planctomycetes bacterium]|nr:sugar phosphate isomerase/epimerase [Planctomycetota bacterium]